MPTGGPWTLRRLGVHNVVRVSFAVGNEVFAVGWCFLGWIYCCWKSGESCWRQRARRISAISAGWCTRKALNVNISNVFGNSTRQRAEGISAISAGWPLLEMLKILLAPTGAQRENVSNNLDHQQGTCKCQVANTTGATGCKPEPVQFEGIPDLLLHPDFTWATRVGRNKTL